MTMGKLIATVVIAATACAYASRCGSEAGTTFRTLGAMIDVSRGRVLRVDYLKGRFERMRRMGYNAVMLYAEDTFRLEGEPKWGYMRGGYTEADIGELKRHADGIGLSMIPCIETLGHMERPLRWPEYGSVRNTDSTLLVGEERTYELIDKMVAFWARAVGGTRIHVGMDEAVGFAGAKYAAKNGRRPDLDVFLGHLARVNDICARHGFTEPIIWSDMLYRVGSKTHDYYDPSAKVDPALAGRIPGNVRLCYWDYYHAEQTYYEGMIDGHRRLGSEPILAGGIQVWQHFFHDREKTLATMKAMVSAAKAKGVEELFFTLWGDDGAYATPDASEEGLFACAELAAGRTADPTDENSARFREITGLDYRAFVVLGDVTRHYGDEWPDMILEAATLYDDPLHCANYRNWLARRPSLTTDRRFYCARYMDAAWRDSGENVMADHRRVLSNCIRLGERLPPAVRTLVTVLSEKLEYQARLLSAWRDGDRAALREIADVALPRLVRDMRAFMAAYRADWMATSQPFGLGLVQKRNAGQLERLEEAKRRLDEYLDGTSATIEELDEAMAPYGEYDARLPFGTPWLWF